VQYSPITIDRCDVGHLTIDILPDHVLLDIFDFYLKPKKIEAWHTLVHVCQKWRNVVLGSPRRLRLQLVCNTKTPVRKLLGVWPPLPINLSDCKLPRLGIHNIIAALRQNSRLHTISLAGPRSQWGDVLATIQGPFPILTRLNLLSYSMDARMLPLPDSFLGGSALRLRHLKLNRISFPLSKLHLCAPDLVDLHLQNIYIYPRSGYMSPEAMITSLSALTRLEHLQLGFISPLSLPRAIQGNRHPRPTRAVLPSLLLFIYEGTNEYLEDLVARFDAPVLDIISISFFYQLRLDTPQLDLFISRSPMFQPFNEVRLEFSYYQVEIRFPHAVNFELGIRCDALNKQLSSLVQLCGPFCLQHLISKVECLYIFPGILLSNNWQNYDEDGQWLEVLCLFIAVKNLYISAKLAGRIMRAMCVLDGESLSEVLPAFFWRSWNHVNMLVSGNPLKTSLRRNGSPVTI
jgi:hypothetical protein